MHGAAIAERHLLAAFINLPATKSAQNRDKQSSQQWACNERLNLMKSKTENFQDIIKELLMFVAYRYIASARAFIRYTIVCTYVYTYVPILLCVLRAVGTSVITTRLCNSLVTISWIWNFLINFKIAQRSTRTRNSDIRFEHNYAPPIIRYNLLFPFRRKKSLDKLANFYNKLRGNYAPKTANNWFFIFFRIF